VSTTVPLICGISSVLLGDYDLDICTAFCLHSNIDVSDVLKVCSVCEIYCNEIAPDHCILSTSDECCIGECQFVSNIVLSLCTAWKLATNIQVVLWVERNNQYCRIFPTCNYIETMNTDCHILVFPGDFASFLLFPYYCYRSSVYINIVQLQKKCDDILNAISGSSWSIQKHCISVNSSSKVCSLTHVVCLYL
jgi:hypothetical protein